MKLIAIGECASPGKAMRKPKITLSDLDDNTYAALMQQAREFVKKEKQPLDGEPIKMPFNDIVLGYGHLVCLSLPPLRFAILENSDIDDLEIENPPPQSLNNQLPIPQ